MTRTLRWALVAAVTITLAGTAGLAFADNCAKKATTSSCAATCSSADQAACAKKCSEAEKAACAKKCSDAEKAACAAKASATEASTGCAGKADVKMACTYCDFMGELRANADKVTFSAEERKMGMVIVFAARSKDDVAVAQALATTAYTMMNTPAHCSVGKAKMAKESCKGCAKGLDAFTGADIEMQNTDLGAKTVVQVEDEKQAEELHAFFRKLQDMDKSQG